MIVFMILCYLLAITCGFGLWFVYYGLESYMNGGYSIWRCFKEEVSWFLPGGRKLKGDYIRKMVDGWNGDGWIGEFSYKEIREDNLYEKVGSKVLPGRIHFLLTHILIPLIPSIVLTMIFQSTGWF